MHKSITPLVAATLGILLSFLAALTWAQQAAPTQEPAAAQPTGPLKLQENAPDSYVVVKGDTLWGISGKFLKDAWRWPEIWKMNQDQIKNPHWIYPGDVVVLDLSGGDPRLRLANRGERVGAGTVSGTGVTAGGGAGGNDMVKLMPRIRSEATEADAIPSIPASVIEPFLTQPLVIEADGLDKAPRVVATEENRVFLGAGNVAYVSGIGESKDGVWQFYRPGKPLVDPDSQKTLGYEAVFLGTGRVEKAGDPATLRVVSVRQEIGSGDRLVPVSAPEIANYVPHAPKATVNGRVMAVFGGLSEGGRSSIITINRGKRDGLEMGHVLALYRSGAVVPERAPGNWTEGTKVIGMVTLPNERYGLVFVFRVFDQVAYALVLQSERPTAALDVVKNP